MYIKMTKQRTVSLDKILFDADFLEYKAYGET